MELRHRAAIGCGKTLVVPLLLAVLSSCSSQPALQPVTGTVTVDGKPAAKVLVLFYLVDDPSPYPSPSSALTDDSGAFALTTAKQGDGTIAGDYAVVCHWYNVRFNAEGEPTYSGPDKLAGRYGNRKTTPLRVTIHPGTHEPLALKLTREKLGEAKGE
jgi:hypothetical protein